MEIKLLSEKYADKLDGALGCYDRVVLTGSLTPFCYAQGMTSYLYSKGIRIFDYVQFAEPLRDEIRANAEALAQTNGLEIEFVRKNDFRKEDRIRAVLAVRGEQPGLVHIFAAMEPCTSYKPWHDKASGKTCLKNAGSKCLHYYFYFIDAELGLCYTCTCVRCKCLRVPTWCPFRLQFYFNGHNWLATQLRERQVACIPLDNAFSHVADYELANQLTAQFDCHALQAKLDGLARHYCPVIVTLNLSYYWSLMQVEYALDLVFKQQATLQAFYPALLETLTHAVKPPDIATFLGKKLHGLYQGEMGNNFNVRLLGTRIRHRMGPVSIKMYDKLALILRIEVTVNDVSFFQHRRKWCISTASVR